MKYGTDLSTLSPRSGLDRRGFLKLGGSAALSAAALSTPLLGMASDDGAEARVIASRSNRKLWREVKKLFVLDKQSTYMNIGTTGSMPSEVLQNYDEYNKTVARHPWDMNGEWGSWPYTSELVERIAPQFGCDNNELVISRNTTDGTVSMLHGLDLRAGDHVIATHHEHVAVTSPLWVLAERMGVDVEYVEIPVFPQSAQEYLDAIGAAIRPGQTRLIVVSHITYKTGATLPVKRICQELAIPNEIVTLIDGAHASGMLDLDLHDLDCDLYAASGHKWQCGPGGTGLLYVRNNGERIQEFWPDREPLWAINSSLAPNVSTFGWQSALQYKGNDNYPALRALADSCDLWSEIGRDKIEFRVKGLSALCKALIRLQFPDARLYSPAVYGLSSGITSFNPFADPTDSGLVTEFRDRLREEYGYIIRYTNFRVYQDDPVDTYALRISTHLFHDEWDVDGLVDAMADLYAQMSG